MPKSSRMVLINTSRPRLNATLMRLRSPVSAIGTHRSRGNDSSDAFPLSG